MSSYRQVDAKHRQITDRRIADLIYRALLLLLLTCAHGGSAAADSDGPDFWMVKDVRRTSSLSVRQQPRLDSLKLGSLPPDARGIENLGCVGESSFEDWRTMPEAERAAAAMARWCNIRYRDLEGWVSGRYLAEDIAAGQ